jgi:hypothetical protein
MVRTRKTIVAGAAPGNAEAAPVSFERQERMTCFSLG